LLAGVNFVNFVSHGDVYEPMQHLVVLSCDCLLKLPHLVLAGFELNVPARVYFNYMLRYYSLLLFKLADFF